MPTDLCDVSCTQHKRLLQKKISVQSRLFKNDIEVSQIELCVHVPRGGFEIPSGCVLTQPRCDTFIRQTSSVGKPRHKYFTHSHTKLCLL